MRGAIQKILTLVREEVVWPKAYIHCFGNIILYLGSAQGKWGRGYDLCECTKKTLTKIIFFERKKNFELGFSRINLGFTFDKVAQGQTISSV